MCKVNVYGLRRARENRNVHLARASMLQNMAIKETINSDVNNNPADYNNNDDNNDYTN